MGNIAVIGSGAWATTAAKILADNGHAIVQLVHRVEYEVSINDQHINTIALPNITLSTRIHATQSPEVLRSASDWVVCVPSKFINQVITQVRPYYTGQPIISLCKGIQTGSASIFISDQLADNFKTNIAVLSGPNLANELAQAKPAAAVVASTDSRIGTHFQQRFNAPYFRIYTSDDPRSVELGGILKNVYAIAAGLVDGLSLGANAKSALMTRGLSEMVQIGAIFGGSHRPFYGLSGIGDLMTTAYSGLSRNWELGYQFAQTGNPSIDRGIPEGARTANQLCTTVPDIAKIAPIFYAVHEIVNNGASIPDRIEALMGRSLKAE